MFKIVLFQYTNYFLVIKCICMSYLTRVFLVVKSKLTPSGTDAILIAYKATVKHNC